MKKILKEVFKPINWEEVPLIMKVITGYLILADFLLFTVVAIIYGSSTQ